MNPIDNLTPEIIAAIKRTCVPGGALPPDAEFSMFLAYCKATGLNPVAKEAYLSERRSKDYAGNWRSSWQIMVARDGYLSAAHRSGRFAGMETRVLPEDPTTTPTHATCRVWRKDWQHPIEVTVSFSEYVEYKDGKPTKMWAGKPRTMIGKVAESQALRRAFGLHGSYSEEELQDEAAGQVSESTSPTSALSGDSPAPALPAPAFKDVLGAKLAEARSKPQPAVPVKDESYFLDPKGKRHPWPAAPGINLTELPTPEEAQAARSKLLTTIIRPSDLLTAAGVPISAEHKARLQEIVGTTSTGKPIVHVLPTHDQDGLPVHPLDDAEPMDEPEGPPSPMPIERQIKEDKGAAIHDIMAELQRVLPPLVGEARKSGDARTIYQGHFFDLAHECFGIELRVMGEFSDRLATLPLMQLVDGLEKLRQLEVRS